MIRLRAEVTFDFNTESLEAGGGRLRELAEAGRGVGFELVAAKVDQAPGDDGSDDDGWTRYAALDRASRPFCCESEAALPFRGRPPRSPSG